MFAEARGTSHNVRCFVFHLWGFETPDISSLPSSLLSLQTGVGDIGPLIFLRLQPHPGPPLRRDGLPGGLPPGGTGSQRTAAPD